MVKATRQSRACTVMPRPRVTKPTISSPGSGTQQRPKRTITSPWPSTVMPLDEERFSRRKMERRRPSFSAAASVSCQSGRSTFTTSRAATLP